MTDDDLECFGTIRDRVINTLDRWLYDDWTEIAHLGVDKDGRVLMSLNRLGREQLEKLVGDAISEAVAMVRSGKDREIIAKLDARDAVGGGPR